MLVLLHSVVLKVDQDLQLVDGEQAHDGKCQAAKDGADQGAILGLLVGQLQEKRLLVQVEFEKLVNASLAILSLHSFQC